MTRNISTSPHYNPDWESQFRKWAKPPTKTEQDRCENAASIIRNAINSSSKLEHRDIKVFLQGSNRNNTNVRKDSDVDVGILCTDSYFFTQFGNSRDLSNALVATYLYSQFKDDVEEALVDYLGHSAVHRGNKAIDIRENSYHVEADVAPFFEHQRHNSDGLIDYGVELRSDNENERIINWPEQHHQNGISKNNITGSRYKSIVRVMKALANEMIEAGIEAAEIPGFLIECLVWSVPNHNFQHQYYSDDVRSSIIYLYENTKTDAICKDWGEVGELKYLFGSHQKWTRDQANAFTVAAWNYLGFEG